MRGKCSKSILNLDFIMGEHHWLVVYSRYRISFYFSLLILLGFIIAECSLRSYVGLGNPPLFQSDPTIEYLYRPNQDVLRFGNQVYINKYSMRSDEFERGKQGSEFRVLCLGDSILDGGALLDQSELATVKLKEMLLAEFTDPVVIANASAKSWGPGNWLAYVEEYGVFDADVVVLVISSHDANDNPTFAALNPNTHPTQRPVSALSEMVCRYLPRYLPKGLFGKSVKPAGSTMTVEEGSDIALSALAELVRLIQAQSCQFVVVAHETKKELGRGKKSRGGLLIEDFFAKQGIEVIDASTYYKRNGRSGSALYQDPIHLNATGQAELANALHTAVLHAIRPSVGE